MEYWLWCNMRNYIFCIVIWLSCGLAFGGEATAEAANNRCRLLMSWSPQAQFAGYYMALEHGLYKKAGIEVEIHHVSAEENVNDYLSENRADVTVGWLLVEMMSAARGADVVNVGQVFEHSGLVIISRRSLPDTDNPATPVNIRTLSDLSNRRIGIWLSEGLSTPVLGMLAHGKVTDYKRLDVLRNVDLFLYGGVDAINGMIFNEYFQILCAGINQDELRVFYLHDIGLDIPEDGLYTTGKFYQDNPELCRNLLAATIEGWRLAVENKEETLKVIKRYCLESKIPYRPAHQRWMLDEVEKLVFPNAIHFKTGLLNAGDYQTAAEMLKQNPEFKNTEFNYNKFSPMSEKLQIQEPDNK